MKTLKSEYGPTALITGASSGIGEAFAREFAAQGLDLVLVARREQRLKQLGDELAEKHGTKTWVIPLDLADSTAAETLYRRVREEEIAIDILVDNAGFGMYGELADSDRDRTLAMIDVNCRAVAEVAMRFLSDMKSCRRGAVIIVASALAFIPAPNLAVYAATKAFDLALGQALYGEMKQYGVDVLALAPTLTATEFHAGAGMHERAFGMRQPHQVVRTALKALGKKAYAVDGWRTKVGLLLARFLPRTWLMRIYRSVVGPGKSK